MKTLVVTIVTRGEDWDTLQETQKQELTKWLRRYDKNSSEYAQALKTVKNSTGLSPATGSVVAIGVKDVTQETGIVYTTLTNECVTGIPDTWQVRIGDEATVLSWFWGGVTRYRVLVSFSGRSFALPFLAHRAVRYDITPARSFLGARRIIEQQAPYHVDMQDELSFYGAMRKRPSLSLWCQTYGISSKAVQTDVPTIEDWCTKNDTTALAEHVVAKVEATDALYQRWCAHLAPAGWSTGRWS